ncbi:MAG: putative COP9 signalosome complex subunit 2, partial [Streblomastix strix]
MADEEYEYEDEEEEEEEEEEEDDDPEDLYEQAKEDGKTVAQQTKLLQKIFDIEAKTRKGKWGFLALEILVQNDIDKPDLNAARTHYTKLLTYIKSFVTKDISQISIKNLLEKIIEKDNKDFSLEIINSTLQALQDAQNERLLTITKMKLANLHYSSDDPAAAERIASEVTRSCFDATGKQDPNKGSQLVESLALLIQIYYKLGDRRKTKEVYEKSLKAENVLTQPKSTSIIREIGGKIHMEERRFSEAR